MPNGSDKNWARVCRTIDGFRVRYGRWPKRLRLFPLAFVDLASHVLTPLGFALVSSVVELVPEEDVTLIAEDGTGAEFTYGQDESPEGEASPLTREWFGFAVLRHDLGP